MHALDAWLIANDLSVIEMADRLGVHRATVHRYITGDVRPSMDVAAKIEEITGGAVKMSDWVRAS